MNKSQIFKAAHALTKATVQAGDSYAVTFAAALRIVIAESKAPSYTFDSVMAAFKAAAHSANQHKLNTEKGISAKARAFFEQKFEADWAAKNKDMRNPRNQVALGLSTRNAMTLRCVNMLYLTNTDLNAVLTMLNLDSDLIDKPASRSRAIKAAFAAV